jgi:hypothetical protein
MRRLRVLQPLLGAEPVLIAGGLAGTALTVAFFLHGMRDTESDDHPDRVVLSEPEQLESEEALAARTPAV